MLTLISRTGGHFYFPEVRFSPEAIGELAGRFQGLLDEFRANPEDSSSYTIQLLESYQVLINSMNEPPFATDIIQDIPVRYMGYPRQGTPGIIVRLIEACRVLLGKPSRSFFTDHHGDVQEGTWKDGVRLQLSGAAIRDLAETALLCRTTPDYVLPAIRFLDPKYAVETPILAPFCLHRTWLCA